ncbi:MAG TPA: AraC family transcriptional regulator [Pyrinomonadaceae bacterium]|nr:AraC family transcriptional regulator [Pyrinomonadaceae bacterium]
MAANFSNSPHEPSNYRVKQAMALIEASLSRKLSLHHIAEELNLSTSRLRHLFKAETGVTPVQYAKFLRMKLAQELAATTFLSVKEILCHLGVGDESHFLRDFKRAHGLTISQYRSRSRSQKRQ